MAGISTLPLLLQRTCESRPLRSLVAFSRQGLFPTVVALPRSSTRLIHVLPQFFARVFARLPVARRLRFGLLCGFPSPPHSLGRFVYLRIFSKVELSPDWICGSNKNGGVRPFDYSSAQLTPRRFSSWGLFPTALASALATERLSQSLPKFSWFLNGSPSPLSAGSAFAVGFPPPIFILLAHL